MDKGSCAIQNRIDRRISRMRIEYLVQLPMPIKQAAQVFPVAFNHGVGHLHGQRLDAVQHLNGRRFTSQVA